MPVYEYINAETGETIEVIQGMKDKHIFIDDQGAQWERVWHAPCASIDSTNINPESKKDFMRATEKQGMNVGEMMDLAKELHLKREKTHGGKDPVKEKVVSDYEKKTNKPHPQKNK
jgi:hypothetical protein